MIGIDTKGHICRRYEFVQVFSRLGPGVENIKLGLNN